MRFWRHRDQWIRKVGRGGRAWLFFLATLWHAVGWHAVGWHAVGCAGNKPHTEGDTDGTAAADHMPLTICQRWQARLQACNLDAVAASTLLFENGGCSEPEDEHSQCLNQCALEMTCDEFRNFLCGAATVEDSRAPLHVVACERDCRPVGFDCADGTTVELELECNGNVNCPDGSDEHEGCPTFACADGTQVAVTAECDTVEQCPDGSDEHEACGHFRCDDGTLIRESLFCDADGYPDCPDGSDEGTACPQFTCDDGAAVVQTAFCDGVFDCVDHSDEPAACRFDCASGGQSIPIGRQCDGMPDCGDGSDEHALCPRAVLCATP